MSKELAEHICNQAFPALSIGMSEDLATHLQSLGYRKFEIVDEPTADKWPKTGGPLQGGGAYWNDPVQHGLTIRDYFAARALQGVFANDAMISRFGKAAQAENVSPDVLAATAAYSVADAMLKERAK